MSWQKEIEELEKRRKLAQTYGRRKGIADPQGLGKMNVRERIAALVDPGTFMERGGLSGLASYDETQDKELQDFVPCPFIMGICEVYGRRVGIHADDFTIIGACV